MVFITIMTRGTARFFSIFSKKPKLAPQLSKNL